MSEQANGDLLTESSQNSAGLLKGRQRLSSPTVLLNRFSESVFRTVSSLGGPVGVQYITTVNYRYD